MLLGFVPAAVMAQSQTDRADPSLMRQEMRDQRPAPAPMRQSIRIQPQADGGTSAQVGAVMVGAVHVEGAVALPASVFGPAIEPFLGRQLSPADLRQLADAVAKAAREAGYGLATAQVPQQVIEHGILRVIVDEGRIDAVEPTGNGSDAIRPLLRKLVNGRPVRTADLERQLLLAGDVAGLHDDGIGSFPLDPRRGQCRWGAEQRGHCIDGAAVDVLRHPAVGGPPPGARIDRVDGRNVLRLRARQDRAAVRASLDNWGSSPIGPLRARLDVDVNGALFADDQLSIGGLITAAQPREFQFVRGAWSVPLGNGGTQLSVSGYYGHSRPGAALKSRNLEGETLGASLAVSHPLIRIRSASLWARADFSMLNSTLDEQGSRIRRDHIRSATASLDGVSRLGNGWLRGDLSVVQGFSGLGATRRGDPLASRSDAGGAYTKLAFSAQYAGSLGGRFSLSLAGEGQLASRPLLSAEEMGLGGRSFLRGYDDWEVAGDEGATASAELRYDLGKVVPQVHRLQLYTYADAGTVHNLKGGTGGGSLASAGGGLRVTLKNGMDANFELGVPLKHSPVTADPKPRFSFALTIPF